MHPRSTSHHVLFLTSRMSPYRHPQSIDALCAIPSRYPNAQSTILTGSSDGILRAVQLFPTKLLGVVTDHGEFPIERIAVDMGGEGRWVGSVGHEEVLKLTDLQEVFEDGEGSDDGEDDSDAEAAPEEEDGRDSAEEDEQGATEVAGSSTSILEEDGADDEKDNSDVEKADSGDDEEEPAPEPKKRKRKKEKDSLLAGRRKKGRNEVEAEPAFFADL